MSTIIRAKRRKNPPASTAVLWVVLGLAVVFFLFNYGQELLLAHQLTRSAALQREANAALRDENTRLKSLLQYYRSDKYVEQRAREDLNLRRPDEEVLIPVLSTSEVEPGASEDHPAPGDDSALSTPTPVPVRANWRRWFDLFTP